MAKKERIAATEKGNAHAYDSRSCIRCKHDNEAVRKPIGFERNDVCSRTMILLNNDDHSNHYDGSETQKSKAFGNVHRVIAS